MIRPTLPQHALWPGIHGSVSMSWCLVVLMLAPAVTVVGYETVGHRHLATALLAN